MLVTRYFPTLGETGQGQQPGALRRGCQAGRKSPLLLTSWCCARQTPSSRPGCRSGAPPTSPQESFSQNLWLLYLRLKRGLTPGTKHNRKADRAGEREDLVLGYTRESKGLPSPSVGRGWQPAITAITAGARPVHSISCLSQAPFRRGRDVFIETSGAHSSLTCTSLYLF